MYHPTTRVLTVLELLQAHDLISGRELARRLEVSERSVRHYVAQLQDLGIPVESELGRYGGYRLRPGFKLPPLMFTADEAVALTVGLLAARKTGLTIAAGAVEHTQPSSPTHTCNDSGRYAALYASRSRTGEPLAQIFKGYRSAW